MVAVELTVAVRVWVVSLSLQLGVVDAEAILTVDYNEKMEAIEHHSSIQVMIMMIVMKNVDGGGVAFWWWQVSVEGECNLPHLTTSTPPHHDHLHRQHRHSTASQSRCDGVCLAGQHVMQSHRV